ncbi:hypothetical protein JI435_421350 [Parastagonospora nodorum SN15]|uniref:Uncharacterized protein n=1 Tax=Phaeosphaeria nodorum (strain SN15 / ATCC MYA-4574 / FGSC 10173) TaxID=321614 RepID=A0A7U2I7A1_PHANO|nr:hypothetical protein JI435_421350 [Parastagonospora nodorum SN15]
MFLFEHGILYETCFLEHELCACGWSSLHSLDISSLSFCINCTLTTHVVGWVMTEEE